MCRDDACVAQRALLKTWNYRLQNLKESIRQKIFGIPETFLSADSLDEAEVNKLNSPVELLNFIEETALLPNHKLTLK